MRDTLLRMKERCDPYVYYNRVRPYIHGWKNSPTLPNGLAYEGVEFYAEPAATMSEAKRRAKLNCALSRRRTRNRPCP